MNFFELKLFYGIGFGIEAINNHVGFQEDEDGEMIESVLNGILIDFLCFRLVIGKTTVYQTMP